MEMIMDTVPEIQEQELRSFVGSGAGYYLRKWRPLLAGESTSAGFNFAAFFFAGLWLPYRKMWRATLLLYGVVLAEFVAEDLLWYVLFRREAPLSFSPVASLIVGLYCGANANRWYLRHTLQAIMEVQLQETSDEARLQVLAARGGTALFPALGLAVCFVGMVVAVGYGNEYLHATVLLPTPEEIAARIEPDILRDWRGKRDLGDASIRRITLTHLGGANYEGHVEAFLLGVPVQLPIKATYKRGTISYEVQQPIPTPQLVAAEAKRLILEKWAGNPELRGASIRNITLVHQGGTLYSGQLEAEVGGDVVRLLLKVTYDQGNITWELSPPAGSEPKGIGRSSLPRVNGVTYRVPALQELPSPPAVANQRHQACHRF
jgi:hypothetical protein